MKVRTKVVKTYHCDVCKTAYPKPRLATNCELMPVENLVANLGDKVRITEPRTCWLSRKSYLAQGVITEITPPEPCDEDYALRFLNGAGIGTHVHQYLVHYKCPRCKEERDHAVYASEFVVLKKSTPKAVTAKAARAT